ncbi:MAG: SPOR domain-containing protein [Proteobacteria bacterium]|nr:SPOR domain-containing protein [Pseudomonadota bacterium]MBU1581633.1 SPOR domain-containing protein [Pseudomonadota bacterium]MBU2630111.1 SPOR domain-containing protein [Pseudomonadota bacterium]
MIWILRHISVHLWIATLITLPVCFYIMPWLTRLFPGINPVITGVVIFSGVGIVIGFLMDVTAKKAVINLIKEGQTWERSGILNKAEKNYINAVRIFDTFLLWPFSAKKTAQKIFRAIAEFKLNTTTENQNFKLISASYLKMNPEDVDIAQLWLKQLRQSTLVSSVDQEVLSLLAETHYTHQKISALLVDIFLGLERKDFTAIKLYQQVLSHPVSEKRYAKKIEDIMGPPDQTIQKQVSFFQPERPPVIPVKKFEITKKIQSIPKHLISYLKRSGAFLGSVLSFLILSVSKGYAYIKEHEKIRFYLKAGFLLIVSIWLAFFMISTVSHIFKSRAIEKEKVKLEIQVPKPFTIQVAAYLTQKHADRYVDRLKKKGIDATVKKVAGGGKTWFVIRVSEFIDKKSATEYGQKLKKEKIIDDFFVNNK